MSDENESDPLIDAITRGKSAWSKCYRKLQMYIDSLADDEFSEIYQSLERINHIYLTRYATGYPVVLAPDAGLCKKVVLRWMEEHGVSYRELAKMCGIHASNLHAMLKGNRPITKTSADAIFSAMN